MIVINYVYLAPVFFFSAVLTLLLYKKPLPALLDQSGDRSLHDGEKPRSGGIAIVASVIFGVCLYSSSLSNLNNNYLIISFLLLILLSLWEDFSSLSQLSRLFAQLIIVSGFVFGADLYYAPNEIESTGLLLGFKLFSVLGFLWLINLYNFMDGMDGFAAGMAVIGFGSFSAYGLLQQDALFLIVNLIIVFSVLGFLLWNFPPAKIFMGDLGSTVLGALAGVVALMGVQRGLFELWVPVVLFSPFWVDATYTLLKRILNKEAFWQAHRSHFYQRLVLKGCSHRQVVLAEYGLMLLCAISVFLPSFILPVLLGLDYNLSPLVICGFWVVIYIALMVVLESMLNK